MPVSVAAAKHITEGLLRSGRSADAVVAANRLLGLAPRDVGALRLAAEARLAAGDAPAASDPIRRARAIDPSCPRLMALEARSLAGAADPQPALGLFASALAAAPEDDEIRLSSLAFLLARDEPARAWAVAEPLVAAGRQTEPSALELMAAAAERADRDEAAAALWSRLVDLAPERPAGHAGLGRLAARSGRPVEALDRFEAALLAAPTDLGVLATVAAAAVDAEASDRASDLIARLETLLPAHPAPHRLAARLAGRAGDPAAAVDHLLRALDRTADDPTLYVALAEALGRQGLWADALRALDTAPAALRRHPIGRKARLAAALGAGDASAWPAYVGADGPPDISAARPVTVMAASDIREFLVLSRWLPVLSACVGAVTLAVDRPLHRLAARLPGVARVADGGPGETGGARLHMRCLPLFGVPDPHMRPKLDAGRVAAWRRRIGGGRCIGVVWDAPAPVLDAPYPRDRLALLTALARSEGVPVAVQWGLAPEAARALGIVPAADAATDFDDLLHLLAAMDTVIGVDGAALHLAALAGVPTVLTADTADSWWWRLPDHCAIARATPDALRPGRAA